MAIETPTIHRLSPSGIFMGAAPYLPNGSVVTNVYKCLFPRGDLDHSMEIPADAPFTVAQFNIALPLVWPATDPPETFDPNKLLYLYWVNCFAGTDVGSGTPGPATAQTRVTVDAPGGVTPVENRFMLTDGSWAYDDYAGIYTERSAVHDVPESEKDFIDWTNHGVFRPGSIPSWSNAATAWVAGATRHIYVDIQDLVDAGGGHLWMPCGRSSVVIVELYGDVTETMGTPFFYEAQI